MEGALTPRVRCCQSGHSRRDDRMPLILPKSAYECWLGQEPDPHDLLTPFAAELMVMWPVSTRVNSPDNDDSSLLDPDREVSAFPPSTLSG
jgi:putative SOS response-associated peptidase YedK